MEQFELTAETQNATVNIGWFRTIESAKEAVKSDKESDNPVSCINGNVEYFWNEEKVG